MNYFGNTPDFQVKKEAELAANSILRKLQEIHGEDFNIQTYLSVLYCSADNASLVSRLWNAITNHDMSRLWAYFSSHKVDMITDASKKGMPNYEDFEKVFQEIYMLLLEYYATQPIKEETIK